MTQSEVDLHPDDAESIATREDDVPVGKLASQVARRIELEVIRRGWPVGASLGSEPDLREHYGVSRSVLREAVRLVEHHQVARMRRGPNGGLFIMRPDAGPATRAVVIYLEYGGTRIDDLMHARTLLEPMAASLAAEAVTEDGIARLRAALGTESRRHGEDGVAAQNGLHLALGELCGNPVLALFIDLLVRLTVRYAEGADGRTDLASLQDVAHDQHTAIVDAVIAGDAGRAHTLMAEHLGAATARVPAQVEPGARRPSHTAAPDPDRDPHAKLAEVVAARVQDDIFNEGREIGTVLGSEAELLERYGVSRAVLREAVRLLEYHAVARMRRGPGGGLVVTRPEPQASIETMALYLEFAGVDGEHLRVVRDAIELGTVARAASRRDEPDVAGRLAAAARWATEGPAHSADKADVFHTELAAVADNPVLTLLLKILTELWRRHTTAQDQPPPGNAVAPEVQHIHERILEAVLAGDEGLARHRMRRHLAALTPWWH